MLSFIKNIKRKRLKHNDKISLQYEHDNQNMTIDVYFKNMGQKRCMSLSYSKAKGYATVCCSGFIDYQKFYDMIMKNRDWLIEEVKKHRIISHSFMPNTTIPYWGDTELTLCHVFAIRKKYVKNENVLTIYCREENFDATVREWLKKDLIIRATQECQRYAAQLNVTFKKVSVSHAIVSWGSCSHQKNLNFNWRLSMASQQILSYVCAHEVTHLRHMNHSEQFWQDLHSICPFAEFAENWLKHQSGRLYHFG